MPPRSDRSSARRSGMRAAARWLARCSAAPRSTSARICSSWAGNPRAGRPPARAGGSRLRADGTGEHAQRRRRADPVGRPAQRGRGARRRARRRRRGSPSVTSTSRGRRAMRRGRVADAELVPALSGRAQVAVCVGGRCWPSRSARASRAAAARRRHPVADRRDIPCWPGPLGVGEFAELGSTRRRRDTSQITASGGLWVSLCSNASRASASASRISPARTSAIARNMLPWASAINQPRGRASRSGRCTARATSSSSLMIRCAVVHAVSSDPGRQRDVPSSSTGRSSARTSPAGRASADRHAHGRHPPQLERRRRCGARDAALPGLDRRRCSAPVGGELRLEPFAQVGGIAAPGRGAERRARTLVEVPDQAERAGAAQGDRAPLDGRDRGGDRLVAATS